MFVSQLAERARQEPARTTWVVVPGHALGHTLAERLAREAGAWANVRFVTPLDLAVRMAAPFLVEQGIDPSDEALGPALVMKLLLELPVDDGYFRPMGEQPSMADALFRAITELRLCGLQAADLRADAFVSPAKHAEIAALLSAYERFLTETRVADAAAVYDEATRCPEYCPLAPDDVVVEWPEAIWPPLVRRFLDALPGTRLASDAIAIPGLHPPRRLAALGAPTRPATPAAACDAAGLLHVMDRSVARPRRAAPDGSLTIFHAGGREAEVDEVLRRVFASGLSVDRVEIACASDTHALLAWEKATRLEWPVTLSTGIPAPLTRPGRALLAWSDWIDEGFPASRLRRALQSGDVSPRAFIDGDEGDGRMSAGQAARLLLRAEAAWGRDTYAPAFERLRAFHEARAESHEREADQQARDRITLRRVDRLDRWVSALLAAIPQEDAEGRIDVQALVSAARAFVSQNALKASYLDAAALVTLDESLGELTALGPVRTSPRAALRLLRERVDALQVGRDRARPGHLFVTTLAHAGLSGRARLFIVGLEEGRVFPTAVEDPILLDAEREALHPGLRRATDRVDEAVWAAVTRLVAAAHEATQDGLCLSFSCRDTREFRETFPSWLVLQAFRVLRGDASLSYPDLAGFLGEPVSAVPADPAIAPTASAWWLAQARRAPAQTAAAALATFPALARGRAALRHRASTAFTPWDGYVPTAGALLDPTQSVFAVSPSRLESAAKCPFRFFLQKGLGVEPLEEEERERDLWLDPLLRGRELHDLFATTLRDLREEKRRPTKADVARVVRRGERRLLQLTQELPPPSAQVFEHERDDFLYDLRLFIEQECERPHVEPLAFEVSFGMPSGSEELEPLALADPIEIALTGARRLRVHGRIDRVDRLADGTFETIDYKTGGFYATDWEGTFAGGTRLQHALYGAAATAMLERHIKAPRVARGTYFFPSARGLGQRITIATPGPATLAEVLGDLADVIAAGSFIQAPKKDACRFCEFAAACGKDPAGRAKPKLEAAAELAAYRKLRGHA